MRFEWGAAKNEENIRKHGIDFEDAHEIFEFPMLVWLDARWNYGEERWVGLGLLRGRVIVIVFTERDAGETTRIISVRKALDHEQRRYEEFVTY